MHTSLRNIAFVITGLLASPALAQTTTSGAGDQPEGTWEPESERMPPPQPEARHEPSPPITRTPGVSVQEEDYLRARFHLGALGGFFFGGDNGGMGGLTAALGLQFNQYIALFAQSIGMFGAFIDTATYQGAVAAFWFNSILFDFTIGHFLQLGAGPSMDFYAAFACDGASASCQNFFLGPLFGLDGRVAIAVGGHDVGTRGAFFVAADLHPTFFERGGSVSAVFAMLFSLGGQVY